jgi:hypothetical protein
VDHVPPETPEDSPLTLADVTSSPMYRELGTPDAVPGEPAIDFELQVLSEGDERRTGRTGRTVKLSDYAGKQPVALIFGSYT